MHDSGKMHLIIFLNMPSLFEIQSMKDSETAFFKYTLRSQSMQNNALFFFVVQTSI